MSDRTCLVAGCERPPAKRGWCDMHYLRWYRHGSTDHPRPSISPDGWCIIEKCARRAVARGLCQTHNRAWKLYGSFDLPGSKPPFGTKWCHGCKTYLPFADFYESLKGRESPCKGCRSKRDKIRRKQRPARVRPSTNRKRRARLKAAISERYTAEEIADRDGWRCQICGTRIGRTFKFPHPRSLSIDHIVPISKDGDDVKANVQAAHLRCNASKHNRGIDQLRLLG